MIGGATRLLGSEFLAPEGPRIVATSEAAARRSPLTRNSWKRIPLMFKSELLRIIRAHGVEFDERYVFD